MTDALKSTAVTFSFLMGCPYCSTIISELDDDREKKSYLHNLPITCPHCLKEIDWWQLVIKTMEAGPLVCGLIGQKLTVVERYGTVGTRASIDWSNEGVPADALILGKGYITNAQITPYQTHSNNPDEGRNGIVMSFYIASSEKFPNAEGADIQYHLLWAPRGPDDISWQNLILAFRAYKEGDFRGMLLPSNAAFEARLGRFIGGQIEKFSSKEKSEQFLTDVSYSHLLNAVLPLMLRRSQLPRMAERLPGLLNRLRRLRNQAAHGRDIDPLQRGEATELICAAFWGFKYVSLLEPLYVAAFP